MDTNGRKNVRKFFGDIENPIKEMPTEEYFVDSIVIATVVADRPEILDGQQGFTTAAIF
jgi:uncharacterized protein with ParB-like and HNH nuclease domain